MSELRLSPLENRSLLRLSGRDAKGFLQNLVTNDLEVLSDTQALYSALLTPQGKFLHDFILLQWENNIFLDCLGERRADLIRRLTMYKLRADVTIEDVTADYRLFAIFGNDTASLISPSLSEGNVKAHEDHLLYSDPRLANLGHRVIAKRTANWKDQYPAFKAVEPVSYIKHRLSLGVPEGGIDITPEKNFLLEANFEELQGVSFSKGCYVGQELTARTKHRAKIKKRLFQFIFEGPLSVGDAISSKGKEIAVVTSFEAPYGLAFIRLSDWQKINANEAPISPEGLVITKPEYVELPREES
ncbi:MAG: folate-binding protein YgfZ [Sneathiella sp.]|nr:folate-binding protein YgfZ [Sneathiella sp.]